MSHTQHPSYDQATKMLARRRALIHAVELVTSRRDAAAIVPADHPERVRDALLKSKGFGDVEAGTACDPEDLNSWRIFRAAAIGTRTPADITVAYLAGPEPENDLDVFLELGVRAENIWAFEIDKNAAAKGWGSLRNRKRRGVKFIPITIEDYFINTPHRFDIVYFDACGPLPSKSSATARVLMTMFRHSALAPLGVLVSNFARPDISQPAELDRHAFLIGAYLYPKGFLESSKGGSVEGARSDGLCFNLPPETPEVFDADGMEAEEDSCPDFTDVVKSDFEFHYGMFITRALMDMATIVAPTARLAGGDLYKVAFQPDLKAAVERGKRLVRFNEKAVQLSEDAPDKHEVEDPAASHPQVDECDPSHAAVAENGNSDLLLDEAFPPLDGNAIIDPEQYSLLWTLAACGAYSVDVNFGPVPEEAGKLVTDWRKAMGGKTPGRPFDELMAIFYAWRNDTALWSDAMQRIAEFPYRSRMPFLCDVPTIEIGFYPAFAQLAYPAHPNVRETKRFRYIAEGKRTPMFMDVIAFDECRYVYDWLSALHLTPEDWEDISAQLTFRFALDGIVKEKRWFGEDFLYGCHVVGESSNFPMSDLKPREDLSPGISGEESAKTDEVVR
ncbi:class I SAM-dependent methyltransferase [Mesorhizobium sp. AD1-1]|uniref:class I SAM-dependent methyltransferase n=1 Tax=Mesorhizobium sp. AD1-1 TaxID=2876621 RepID=UPI001CCA15D5|nr:class I SAM-dependent methyltransferase [Mesorhizobium sp. AD1-1]MBZ9719790.1 class I SAM-dependent methyltransferase [Mesorhizobium sp. AD1-1]